MTLPFQKRATTAWRSLAKSFGLPSALRSLAAKFSGLKVISSSNLRLASMYAFISTIRLRSTPTILSIGSFSSVSTIWRIFCSRSLLYCCLDFQNSSLSRLPLLILVLSASSDSTNCFNWLSDNCEASSSISDA